MKWMKRILKIAVCVLIFAVFALIIGRIAMLEHYPKQVTRVQFTPALEQYYREDPEGFRLYTQDWGNENYDSEKKGFFFAEIVFAPEAEHIQLTVRYNESIMAELAEEYGAPQDPDTPFVYSLCVYYGEEEGTVKSYPLSDCVSGRFWMYQDARLMFDGVDFTDAAWMRVDVEYNGETITDLHAYYNQKTTHEYEIFGKDLPK